MGMSPRHISPQSFDAILSDLGPDPAIHDPHGIRKSAPQKSPEASPAAPPKSIFPNIARLQPTAITLGGIGLIALLLGGLLFSFFLHFQSLEADARQDLITTQERVLTLQKELSALRQDVEVENDELYELMEEIEVSIHSKNVSTPITAVVTKPQAPSEESELRRWRYLGSSQAKGSRYAFFQTSKGVVMHEQGLPVLGDWHLSGIEQDHVTLSHPKTKPLILRATRSE